MSNILLTKQLRVLRVREEESDVERIKREADPGTYASTAIDLLDVTGVAASVDNDGKVNDDESVLMYGEGEVVIETPFREVYNQWLVTHGDQEIEVKEPDLGQAVATLARALEEARNGYIGDHPESLYFGYQSNIAMAFFDEYDRYRRTNLPKSMHDMPETERISISLIANAAAKRFLNMFIDSIKTPSK